MGEKGEKNQRWKAQIIFGLFFVFILWGLAPIAFADSCKLTHPWSHCSPDSNCVYIDKEFIDRVINKEISFSLKDANGNLLTSGLRVEKGFNFFDVKNVIAGKSVQLSFEKDAPAKIDNERIDINLSVYSVNFGLTDIKANKIKIDAEKIINASYSFLSFREGVSMKAGQDIYFANIENTGPLKNIELTAPIIKSGDLSVINDIDNGDITNMAGLLFEKPGDVTLVGFFIDIGDIKTIGIENDAGNVNLDAEIIKTRDILVQSVAEDPNPYNDKYVFGKAGKITIKNTEINTVSQKNPLYVWVQGSIKAHGLDVWPIDIAADKFIRIEGVITNYSGCVRESIKRVCDRPPCLNKTDDGKPYDREFCANYKPSGNVFLKAGNYVGAGGINVHAFSPSEFSLSGVPSGAGTAGKVTISAADGDIYIGSRAAGNSIYAKGFQNSFSAVNIYGKNVFIEGNIITDNHNATIFPIEAMQGAGTGAGRVLITAKNNLKVGNVSAKGQYPFAPDGGSVSLQAGNKIDFGVINTDGFSLSRGWHVLDGLSIDPATQKSFNNIVDPAQANQKIVEFCDGTKEYFDGTDAGDTAYGDNSSQAAKSKLYGKGPRGGNAGAVTIRARETNNTSNLAISAKGGSGSSGGAGGLGYYCGSYLGNLHNIIPFSGHGAEGGRAGNGGSVNVILAKSCFSYANISAQGGQGGDNGKSDSAEYFYTTSRAEPRNCQPDGWEAGSATENKAPAKSGDGGKGGSVYVYASQPSNFSIKNFSIANDGGNAGNSFQNHCPQCGAYPFYCPAPGSGPGLKSVMVGVQTQLADADRRYQECKGKIGYQLNYWRDTCPASQNCPFCRSYPEINFCKPEDGAFGSFWGNGCSCQNNLNQCMTNCSEQYGPFCFFFPINTDCFECTMGCWQNYQSCLDSAESSLIQEIKDCYCPYIRDKARIKYNGDSSCCAYEEGEYLWKDSPFKLSPADCGCQDEVSFNEYCRETIVETPCQSAGFTNSEAGFLINHNSGSGFSVSQKGGPSFNGQAGALGGNAGSINVYTKLDNISVSARGGNGGIGSAGQSSFVLQPGSGGKGGSGGRGGTIMVPKISLVDINCDDGDCAVKGGNKGTGGQAGLMWAMSLPIANIFGPFFMDWWNIRTPYWDYEMQCLYNSVADSESPCNRDYHHELTSGSSNCPVTLDEYQTRHPYWAYNSDSLISCRTGNNAAGYGVTYKDYSALNGADGANGLRGLASGLLPASARGSCSAGLSIEKPIAPEPQCGNNTAEIGEECGEPNLDCSSGKKCLSCRCIEQPSAEFNFIVYGDTRTGDEVHRQIVDKIYNEHSDLVFHTGDYVTDAGSGDEWGRVSQILSPLINHAPNFGLTNYLYPVVGNHEDKPDGLADFIRIFPYYPKLYYSFDYKNAHFIVLYATGNSVDAYKVGSEQYEWLKKDLDMASATSAKWKFVLFHAPPFSCTTTHACNSNIQENLLPLFEQYGVTAVFNGHNHSYQRVGPVNYSQLSVNSPWYITTGGGGAPLYDVSFTMDCNIKSSIFNCDTWTNKKHKEVKLVSGEKDYHYVRLRVTDDYIMGEAVKIDGTIIDCFLINPSNAVVLEPTTFAPEPSLTPLVGDLSVSQSYTGRKGEGFVGLQWIYQSQTKDGQSQYHLQLATSPDFQNENLVVDTVVNQEVLTGAKGTSGLIVRLNPSLENKKDSDIGYNQSYYWRIKTKSENGIESKWVEYDKNNDEIPDRFNTISHPNPWPDFNWTSEKDLGTGKIIYTFQDKTEFYDGTCRVNSDNPGCRYSWRFTAGERVDNSKRGPRIIIETANKNLVILTITLEITDSDGFKASKTEKIQVKAPPQWKEEAP